MTIQEAKAQIAASTVYKTWDNIKQELSGTSEYEELMDRVSLLLESELNDTKYLVKMYSRAMTLNLEAYQKATERGRVLLKALDDLYFFTPDFPDRNNSINAPSESDWEHGLEKATRNAKKAIEEAKKIIS